MENLKRSYITLGSTYDKAVRQCVRCCTCRIWQGLGTEEIKCLEKKNKT